jgi:hypothetical protein
LGSKKKDQENDRKSKEERENKQTQVLKNILC